MKRIMILFLAVGMSAGVMAQRIQYPSNLQDKKSSNVVEQEFKMKSSNTSKEDTYLLPSSFNSCANIEEPYKYVYVDENSQQIPYHYVTGSNLADDRAYAQQYTRNQAISVKGIAAILEFESLGAAPTQLKATMYSASSTGIGNELTSKAFYDTVLANGYEFQFPFASPVSSSNFAVAISVPGLEVEEIDETLYLVNNFVVVASTEIGCASGGKSYSYSANQDGSFSWVKFSAVLSGQDLDLFIFPIVDATHGLTSVDVNELSYVYPNPAKDEVIIASSIEMNKVEIYNMVGQKVYESNAGGISARVNVANFNTGSYVAKIYTEAGIATKKIIVE